MYNIIIDYKLQVFFLYKILYFRLEITVKDISVVVEDEPNQSSSAIPPIVLFYLIGEGKNSALFNRFR